MVGSLLGVRASDDRNDRKIRQLGSPLEPRGGLLRVAGLFVFLLKRVKQFGEYLLLVFGVELILFQLGNL